MANPKRVLVTGAGGFIRHHLVTFLRDQGYWVRGVDLKHPEYEPTDADEFALLDLCRWDDCLQATRHVDDVYALAADMGGMGLISTHHAQIWHNSSLINIHTLRIGNSNGLFAPPHRPCPPQHPLPPAPPHPGRWYTAPARWHGLQPGGTRWRMVWTGTAAGGGQLRPLPVRVVGEPAAAHPTADLWRAGERLSLVVPMYCEAHCLLNYVDELLAFVGKPPTGSELIFVDDGSTDDTYAVLEGLLANRATPTVRVLRHPHRGKGAAVRAGLEGVHGTLAGFCDLDLSTSLRDLEVLVDIARNDQVIAIDSRGMSGSELVRPEDHIREFLGRAFNQVVQFVLVPGIVDTQCGAKVARTDIWRRVLPACKEDDFAWDVEVIAVARGFGIGVCEIPVSWWHDPNSKVHVLRDGLRMLAALPRISRHVRQVTASPAGADVTDEVFEGENASDLGEADASHWWFRSKARFVSTALQRYSTQSGWLLDVGAGAGGVTAQIGWEPRKTLVVEGSKMLARHASSRHALAAVNARVADLPVADGSASVVCFLDVLEHLAHPEEALAEASRVLAPGGCVIVTVPAHPRLWSAADEHLGHKRRYTRALARAQLVEQGFNVRYISHIFSWLLLPVWVTRRTRSGGPELGLDVASPVVDRAAALLTWIENVVVSLMRLPFGTSILCVAERP